MIALEQRFAQSARNVREAARLAIRTALPMPIDDGRSPQLVAATGESFRIVTTLAEGR